MRYVCDTIDTSVKSEVRNAANSSDASKTSASVIKYGMIHIQFPSLRLFQSLTVKASYSCRLTRATILPFGREQWNSHYDIEGTNNYHGVVMQLSSELSKTVSIVTVRVGVQWISIPLPLCVWTIQKTFLIPIAGNIVESKRSALLNLTKPTWKLKTSENITQSLMKTENTREYDIIITSTYLEPTLGMPML